MADGWSKTEMAKEIDRALGTGRRLARSEPRAASARYDRRTRRMVMELTNGCSFVFPPRALQSMARASRAALADVEILGQGPVDIRAERGRIVIEPLRSTSCDLADMVKKITRDNLHDEIDFGRPAGKEHL